MRTWRETRGQIIDTAHDLSAAASEFAFTMTTATKTLAVVTVVAVTALIIATVALIVATRG